MGRMEEPSIVVWGDGFPPEHWQHSHSTDHRHLFENKSVVYLQFHHLLKEEASFHTNEMGVFVLT